LTPELIPRRSSSWAVKRFTRVRVEVKVLPKEGADLLTKMGL